MAWFRIFPVQFTDAGRVLRETEREREEKANIPSLLTVSFFPWYQPSWSNHCPVKKLAWCSQPSSLVNRSSFADAVLSDIGLPSITAWGPGNFPKRAATASAQVYPTSDLYRGWPSIGDLWHTSFNEKSTDPSRISARLGSLHSLHRVMTGSWMGPPQEERAPRVDPISVVIFASECFANRRRVCTIHPENQFLKSAFERRGCE